MRARAHMHIIHSPAHWEKFWYGKNIQLSKRQNSTEERSFKAIFANLAVCCYINKTSFCWPNYKFKGKWYTFSTSKRDDNDWFCRTSGAVNARRSWWETFSSVNDTLPDGSNSRDHGEMMKPKAVGSAIFEKNKQHTITMAAVSNQKNFMENHFSNKRKVGKWNGWSNLFYF